MRGTTRCVLPRFAGACLLVVVAACEEVTGLDSIGFVGAASGDAAVLDAPRDQKAEPPAGESSTGDETPPAARCDVTLLSAECNDCVAYNCPQHCGACGLEPDCLALYTCLASVVQAPDAGSTLKGCTDQYPKWVDAVDALTTCGNNACLLICFPDS